MSNLNRKLLPEYTVDAIGNIMSLRKPQKQSIKILDSILDEVPLKKDRNLAQEEMDIRGLYPIFKDYEHDFMSLTFALATGVGKTKLMGAFITYLYTNKGVKNFFVVAPNLTIYEKLKNDLGEPSLENEKYVFRGVSCFATKRPNLWVGDDYLNKPLVNTIDDADSINIYIFNISKFNSEERNIRDEKNEAIGMSFFNYLKSLDDLVIIMDESHHYRAQSSISAINELNPVLGLELTATPQTQSGSSTVLFRNVVYEYPLSRSIKDGYTRTPYALTRSDFNPANLTNEEIDKIMIGDGIKRHEDMKVELKKYYINHKGEEGVRLVKPFMLIVCKDTEHAQSILNYVKSTSFKDGKYANKVVMVHSNQRGQEKEENVRLLLNVEKNDNPIEIVIHVNILKEGWDVNNLYTIVPLRTATSRTLREQTIGRGLRLPFGKRTGEKWVDSVAITAHDKFDEIVQEAQSEDSVFNSMGVIYMDHEKERRITRVNITLFDDNSTRQGIMNEAGLDNNNEEHVQMIDDVAQSINTHVAEQLHRNPGQHVNREEIRAQVEEDLAHRYSANEDVQRLLEASFGTYGEEVIERAEKKVMYIPQIRTEEFSGEKYEISPFDLDLSDMRYVPLRDDIVIKNLTNAFEDVNVIRGEVIDYESIKPEKELVDGICEINEVDYEKCPELIQKLVMQFLDHYRSRFNETEVRNIVIMNRRDIINKFKAQILQHLTVTYSGIVEVISGIKTAVADYVIDTTNGVRDFHQSPATGENISSIAYNGATKAVQAPFKFDSNPERIFAVAIDGSNSPEVIQWLRPSPTQFNITYNRGKRYEPDFVVETDDSYYLVEVKARNQMNDPDVLAKKERAIKYCKVATEYNKAHGHKGFKYLFIPHDEIRENSSFKVLMQRFIEE